MKARTDPPPEAQKLLEILSEENRPMAVRELVRRLGVAAADRPGLRKRLRALAEEGVLVRVRSRYALPASLSLQQGTFRGHPEGYGFVLPDEAEEGPGRDVLVPRRYAGGALDGDRVRCRVEKVHADGRREGRILAVLERARPTLVGRLVVDGRRAWVEPQERRIPFLVHLGRSNRGGAHDGELVEVEITQYPAPRKEMRGAILRSFGYPADPAAEQLLIIAKYGLREEFPDKALREAEASRPPSEEAPWPEGVEDLRGLTTFTIDPRTARDRDDAVSIEKLPGGGWRLGVHIADVSHYVRPGSALDREAFARSNSVYFPDRALPMLPPRLSGDVCSLNADQLRRTLSLFLDYDAGGRRRGFRFTVSRIRSRAQLTYAGAGAVLEGREVPEADELRPAAEMEKELRALSSLARALRARRKEAGTLDFELPEAVVLLDRKGDPFAIRRAPRNEAHRLVEECMLAANRAVAEVLAEADGAAVFRVHAVPDEEKLRALRLVLSNMRLEAPAVEDLKRPRVLQGVLDAVRGTDVERFVNLLVLRTMKLAAYENAPAPHFGLGFECYTHFTSPIRRYADLLVHRRIKQLLHRRGRAPEAGRLAEICARISERERTAERAEREMVDFHKALFMKEHVGERYEGHVSGVAPFGVFVELEDIFVEGMAPLQRMTDDYYLYLPEAHAVIGERTGRRFRLGDAVTVRVEGVDLGRREVNFQLLSGGSREAEPGKARPAGRRRVAGKRRPQKEGGAARPPAEKPARRRGGNRTPGGPKPGRRKRKR